jgi:hypothetical protein
MSVEAVIKLGVGKIALTPSPINPGWILEGHPVARNQLISSSADGLHTALRIRNYRNSAIERYTPRASVFLGTMNSCGHAHRVSPLK